MSNFVGLKKYFVVYESLINFISHHLHALLLIAWIKFIPKIKFNLGLKINPKIKFDLGLKINLWVKKINPEIKNKSMD